MEKNYKEIKELIKEKFKENKSDIIKMAIVLLVIYIVAMIPIIRANYSYADDIGRAIYGGPNWNDYSRYGSSTLSFFIHGGNYLVDISPLPQILALVVLIISSILLIYIISDDKKFNIWKVIAVIPLGLSPYFLECLSYKYDAVYMALSILVSIIPFMFYKRKKILFYIVTVISILLMCMTYQASSGIFIMITLLLCLKMWNNNEEYKKIGMFLLFAILGYLTGVIIFKIFIMKIVNSNYVSNEIFPFDRLFTGIYNNLFTYFKNIINDYSLKWKVLFLIMSICFIINSTIKSKRNKIISFIVSTIILLIMLLASFGLYPVLQKLIFQPRTLYGIGVFTAIICLYAVDYKKAYIPKIAVFVLSYLCIIFCMTYGNALAEQQKYTDYRIQLVISDINDLEIIQNNKTKRVQISGDIGKCKAVSNLKDNIMNKLVRSTFRGKWYWAQEYFFGYFGLRDKKLMKSNETKSEENLTLVKETLFHDIYAEENYILIKLK